MSRLTLMRNVALYTLIFYTIVVVYGQVAMFRETLQKQEILYVVATNEYEQHRCRDTQTTTTNRLFMVECHRLGLILEQTPVARTLTLTLNRWEGVMNEWLSGLLVAMHHVVMHYAYRIIFLLTSLCVCLQVYQHYLLTWSGDTANAYRRDYDRLRSELTEQHLVNTRHHHHQQENPIYNEKHMDRIAKPIPGYRAWWCK